MTEATSIATIFEDFAIDHTPDGWPAVQQMHLNAAAAELRRLQTAEDEQLTALGACRDAMPHTAANISGAIGCPLTVPAYVRETVSLLVSQLQTERTARQAAQIENEALKERLVRADAEKCAAVLAALSAALAEPAPVQEPMAGQCRFKNEQQWRGCSVEHVQMVRANPGEWKDYEVRMMYAEAQQPVPVQEKS